MKIVDRKTFLAMPSGTVYCQCADHYAWSGIRVRRETCKMDTPGDWFELELTNIEADSSHQLFDRYEEMHEQGTSYPLDLEGVGRDGLFDREALFLVYEAEDVRKLRDLFTALCETAPQ